MEKKVFTLEGKELEAATVWRLTHSCDLSATPSSDRADFSYIFAPGGLGTYVTVRCDLCGKSCDVTDCDCW